MSDPTLFDIPPVGVSEQDLDACRTTTVRAHTRVVAPRARRTDPVESQVAAVRVAPGGGALIAAIRAVVAAGGPSTQHTIAQNVSEDFPGRWQPDTIRSACARAGLVKVGTTNDDGVTGRAYGIYDLEVSL